MHTHTNIHTHKSSCCVWRHAHSLDTSVYTTIDWHSFYAYHAVIALDGLRALEESVNGYGCTHNFTCLVPNLKGSVECSYLTSPFSCFCYFLCVPLVILNYDIYIYICFCGHFFSLGSYHLEATVCLMNPYSTAFVRRWPRWLILLCAIRERILLSLLSRGAGGIYSFLSTSLLLWPSHIFFPLSTVTKPPT